MVLIDGAHARKRHVGSGREICELAGFQAAEIVSGYNPERSRVVLEQAGDAIVGEPIFDGIGAKTLVLIAREAVRRANPKDSVAARCQGCNRVAW
jgi:hypothetical protein